MLLPRFGMRKKTQSIVSGLVIAVTSLIGLAYAYEEARNNLVYFFVGILLLLLLILVCAAALVAVLNGGRYLARKLSGRTTKEAEDRKE